MPIYGTRIRFFEAFFIGMAVLLIIIRAVNTIIFEMGKGSKLERETLDFCE
jgi:hypothetical protein